jgi:hypothetical protein
MRSNYSLRGSASASRVTDHHKVDITFYGRYSHSRWDYPDGSELVIETENYSADALSAWSIDDHWSAGATASANRETYRNFRLATAIGPAVEYSIFPYDESTRKAITLRYTVEVAAFDYDTVTTRLTTSDLFGRHRLTVGSSIQQPWGQIFGSVGATQYFHDPKTHRIDVFAGGNVRLFRGLSFNMFGSFSRVKDQFYLPAQGQTIEEIIANRQALETNYEFNLNMGFTFRFGSRFNNVVNPRMGGGGMMFFIG